MRQDVPSVGRSVVSPFRFTLHVLPCKEQFLVDDLKHAVRQLRSAPGFTIVALLTLALGIGANTAIFSVLYGMLLRPLPYPQPDRLVQLAQLYDGQRGDMGVTYPQFRFLHEHNTIFESSAAATSIGMNLYAGGEAERVDGLRVSSDYFRVLGGAPLLGRTFTPDEDREGGSLVVVLSHGLWQSRFGGDRDVVGRSVTIDGRSYTVVGVMPPHFQSMPAVEVWSTLAQVARTVGSGQNLTFIGRLKPGLTVPAAEAAFASTVTAFKAEFPNNSGGSRTGIGLDRVQDSLVRDVRTPVRILFGAIGFVLLIACANVANLMLGRTAARGRELSVRAALGASRPRLVRQLLTESMLLSVAGAALGLLVAQWMIGTLMSLAPSSLTVSGPIGLDLSVLGFTALLAVVTGIAFGIAPAWRASRVDLHDALKEGARGTGGPSGNRLRGALVVGEIALSLVLLAGAGLLIQTVRNLVKTDPGFDTRNLLTAEIWLSGSGRDTTTETISGFYNELTQRLAAMPGVASASVVEAGLPLQRGGNMPVSIDGAPVNSASEYRSVTPDYLTTLGAPLLGGRMFGPGDVAGAEPVALVNAAFARRYFDGADPLGHTVKVGGSDQPRRIVGMVGDLRSFIGRPAASAVFIPSAQTQAGVTRVFSGWFPTHVVLRTSGNPDLLRQALVQAIRETDARVPIGRVRTMNEVLANSLAFQRFLMLLLSVFAFVALLLSAVGIYGVMSYLVAQRTREIGLRLALGARPRKVLGSVVGRSMLLAGAGAVLGVAGAVAATRVLSGQLFEVRAADPRVLAAVTAVLLLVALLASWLPARRAARVDPMIALRND